MTDNKRIHVDFSSVLSNLYFCMRFNYWDRMKIRTDFEDDLFHPQMEPKRYLRESHLNFLAQAQIWIIFYYWIDNWLLLTVARKWWKVSLSAMTLMETLFHDEICYAHNNYTPLFNSVCWWSVSSDSVGASVFLKNFFKVMQTCIQMPSNSKAPKWKWV